MGGTWEGGQGFDLSSEGSLDDDDAFSPGQSIKNPNKSGTRPSKLLANNIQHCHERGNKSMSVSGVGSRRVTENTKNNVPLVDSESEGSDLEADDQRLEGSESDVTIDEWQTEVRTWEVGPGNRGNNNNNNRSPSKNNEQQLIKPTPARINSEDDF